MTGVDISYCALGHMRSAEPALLSDGYSQRRTRVV
jgi:hypothetical protein